MAVVVVVVFYVTYSETQFSDTFTQEKRKEELIMLEKFILRWGQTEEPCALKPTLEGNRVESDAFCLVSQIFLYTSPGPA